MTGKTVDKSKYLDFGFYEKFWFKNNTGLSIREPGRLLRISHQKWRLMCYNIFTKTGKVISRSMLHQATNIKLYTVEAKENLVNFDTEIHRRLK